MEVNHILALGSFITTLLLIVNLKKVKVSCFP